MRIDEHSEPFPGPDGGLFPDGTLPSFARKKDAKKYAAKCAVEWLGVNGYMSRLDVNGVKSLQSKNQLHHNLRQLGRSRKLCHLHLRTPRFLFLALSQTKTRRAFYLRELPPLSTVTRSRLFSKPSGFAPDSGTLAFLSIKSQRERWPVSIAVFQS